MTFLVCRLSLTTPLPMTGILQTPTLFNDRLFHLFRLGEWVWRFHDLPCHWWRWRGMCSKEITFEFVGMSSFCVHIFQHPTLNIPLETSMLSCIYTVCMIFWITTIKVPSNLPRVNFFQCAPLPSHPHPHSPFSHPPPLASWITSPHIFNVFPKPADSSRFVKTTITTQHDSGCNFKVYHPLSDQLNAIIQICGEKNIGKAMRKCILLCSFPVADGRPSRERSGTGVQR